MKKYWKQNEEGVYSLCVGEHNSIEMIKLFLEDNTCTESNKKYRCHFTSDMLNIEYDYEDFESIIEAKYLEEKVVDYLNNQIDFFETLLNSFENN